MADRPPTPPDPPKPSRTREPGSETSSTKGTQRRQAISDAVGETRAALESRIAAIDPSLLLELTVGIRSLVDDASWTDSWGDRFSDNGRFDDQWINLSGDQSELTEEE
jgi:hypothetical protein